MALKIILICLFLALFEFQSCRSAKFTPLTYSIVAGFDFFETEIFESMVRILLFATEEANTIEFQKGNYTLKNCAFQRVSEHEVPVNFTITDDVVQIFLPETTKKANLYSIRCLQEIHRQDHEGALHWYLDEDEYFFYAVLAYRDKGPHDLYISLDDFRYRNNIVVSILSYVEIPLAKFWPARMSKVNSSPSPPLPTFLFNFFNGDTVELRNITGRKNFTLNARPAIALLNQDIYLDALVTVEQMEQKLGSYLNFTFPFNFIDTLILPHLVPEVLDTLGLMFIPEESVTVFYKESELKMLISQKMSAQYFGAVLVPANKQSFWMSYGLQNFLQYKNFEDDGTLAIERMLYYSCVSAMQEDGWSFTHPVIDPRDDVITREKAGCLFLLLRDYLGEYNFQKVLQQYIAQYKYKPATPYNFRDVIRKVVQFNDTDMTEILIYKFIQNRGYPVVFCERKNDGFGVSQSRFSYEHRGDTSRVWVLPLNYGNSNASVMYHEWLNGTYAHIIDEKIVHPGDILIMNYGWKGFYRVNYDRASWALLTTKLVNGTFEDIPAENRAQLIDDSMNLARGYYFEHKVPLGLVEYLNREMDFLPWAVAHDNFKYLYRMMEGPYKDDIDNLLLLKKFIRSKVEHIFRDDPPWLKELSHMDLVLELSCLSNGVYCETKSKEVFKNGSATDIDPFYGNALGCRLAHKLDNMEWAYEFLNQTNKTDLERRRFFLRILPCSLDPRSFLYSITDTFLNVSKTLSPLEHLNMMSHTVHFSTYWNLAMVLEHTSQLVQQMYNQSMIHQSNVRAFVTGVARRIFTEHLETKYQHLLNVTKQCGIMTETEMVPLRKITAVQVQWRKDHLPRIVAYLKQRKDKTQMEEKKNELKKEYCQKLEEALMMNEINAVDEECRSLT